MIFFLTTKRHDYTIRKCLRTEGRELVEHVRPLCYGRLFLMRRFQPGAYVFADLERLSTADRNRAQHVWDCLSSDAGCRVLNHPRRSWRRYTLLRTLAEQGVNQFNAYRLADDPRPTRFPVFVRGENDHKGPQSSLIRSQAELDDLCVALDRTWKGRDGRIATEFCDVSDANGVYRKYSAFRIGDRILPRHLFFSRTWCVKNWELLDAELLAEERRYIADNPHRDQLYSIFDRAHIDFGRIDYGVVNGRIQVWEINTNPMLPVDYGGGGPLRNPLHKEFRDVFVDAVRAIDVRSAVDSGVIEAVRPAVPLWAAAGIPWRNVARRFARRAA